MSTEDATGEARSRWDARHAERPASTAAASFLTDRADLLPSAGRALDVAGGTGRNTIWLARRGLEVTLLDVSPVALERASATARAAGVDIATLEVDLSASMLPAGPYDVVLVHHFLDRDVWGSLPGLLAPGGLLLACQPTVRNLERHTRPSRRWLLEAGEIQRIADGAVARAADLEVVEVDEAWTDEDRHEGRLVLRRRR